MLLTRRRLLAGLAASPAVTFNPNQIAAAGGLAQGRPGPAVAVTATSSGNLTGPSGFTYAQVVISNASPWLMQVTTAEGNKTIPPYTADLIVPVGAGVPYQMSAAPGATITPLNPYVQPDWYVAGGGTPAGVFPYPLTSQAVIAGASPASQVIPVAPAGGEDWQENFVQAGRLQMVRAVFTAGATVIDRQPSLLLSIFAGAPLMFIPISTTVRANQVVTCQWFPGAPWQRNFGPVTPGSETALAPFPPVTINSGWLLESQTANIQATDLWSNIVILLG